MQTSCIVSLGRHGRPVTGTRQVKYSLKITPSDV